MKLVSKLCLKISSQMVGVLLVECQIFEQVRALRFLTTTSQCIIVLKFDSWEFESSVYRHSCLTFSKYLELLSWLAKVSAPGDSEKKLLIWVILGAATWNPGRVSYSQAITLLHFCTNFLFRI